MNHVAINVRKLRLAKGMTQGDLALSAGVARPTISNLESADDTGPSLRTLRKVASALETDVSSLVTPLKMPQQIRFRAMQEFKSREQVVVDAMHAYELYRKLERETKDDLPLGGFKDLADELKSVEEIGEERARHAARLVRNKLNISPDTALPRITSVIEHLGIRVITIPYHADAFGLSFISPEGFPVVVVNMSERITVERWIFSAAHELGHLLLHWDDKAAFDVAEEDLEEENEANIFAAELLMPTAAFKKAWDALDGEMLLDKVLSIKRSFIVSYQTVLYRASSLNGGKEAYQKDLQQFMKEYHIRYGLTLTRKDEGHIQARADAYDPYIIPVSTTSEEPENVGAGSPRRDMFLPQGRMMRLVIKGVEKSYLEVEEVQDILHTSRETASRFINTVKGKLPEF